MADKADPQATACALIDGAITAARVMGESARVTRSVASSIGRLEAEHALAGALLRAALGHIGDEQRATVPQLFDTLQRLLAVAEAAP